MKIFITGGTGFLGQYLIRELAPFCTLIYVLSRKKNNDFLENIPNVKIIKGDITSLTVIEDNEERKEVQREVDCVVHAAALYDIAASHAECYLQNVVGTQNVLRLTNKIKNLKALYYISTIAVGDDQTYLLEEDIFPPRKKFKDFYSETKYHAEKIIRETSNRQVTRIIRPGIIVGDSITGKMNKVDGPYYFIEVMKKYSKLLKMIPFLPLSYHPRTLIPMIPVDHCARFIALLIKRDQFEKELKTYHLISDEVPSVKEFLYDLNQSFNLKTQYIPLPQNKIYDSLVSFLGIPKELTPFMFSKLSYEKTRTDKELPELKDSIYRLYKDNIL